MLASVGKLPCNVKPVVETQLVTPGTNRFPKVHDIDWLPSHLGVKVKDMLARPVGQNRA